MILCLNCFNPNLHYRPKNYIYGCVTCDSCGKFGYGEAAKNRQQEIWVFVKEIKNETKKT